MIKYVVGFMFDHSNTSVALIQKKRPEWQAGKLNGVGGKIERLTQNHTCYDIDCDVSGFDPCNCPYETPYQAMCREFKEETALDVTSWEEYARLSAPGKYQVHFFRALEPQEMFSLLRSTTDEEVGTYRVENVPHLPIVSNLRWLIPMALERSDMVYYITNE